MKKLLAQIDDGEVGTIELPNGLLLEWRTHADDAAEAPWKQCDGHGPVKSYPINQAEPQKSGEIVLWKYRATCLCYDKAEAIAIAKRDRWGDKNELAKIMGRKPTRNELATWAVEADFKYLQDWCSGEWQYLVVTVSLTTRDGNELAFDAVGGVESCGAYWKQVICETALPLIDQHIDGGQAGLRAWCFWNNREKLKTRHEERGTLAAFNARMHYCASLISGQILEGVTP